MDNQMLDRANNANELASKIKEKVTELESKTGNPQMIPYVAFEITNHLAEKKEKRLVKVIVGLMIAWAVSVIGTVGGFLYYLSQYTYAGVSQDISEVGGNGTINDGININGYGFDAIK